MSLPRRNLLIISLGNPPPLATTLHSAGHVLLKAVRTALSSDPMDPSTSITLRECPTLMNASGPWALRTWKQFLAAQSSRSQRSGPERGEESAVSRLVILHDELEQDLGVVKVREGLSGSAKGHNGIRSIFSSFASLGPTPSSSKDLLRIGIGISRPLARDRDAVSNWVLREMTAKEKGVLTGERVVGEVLRVLRDRA